MKIIGKPEKQFMDSITAAVADYHSKILSRKARQSWKRRIYKSLKKVSK